MKKIVAGIFCILLFNFTACAQSVGGESDKQATEAETETMTEIEQITQLESEVATTQEFSIIQTNEVSENAVNMQQRTVLDYSIELDDTWTLYTDDELKEKDQDGGTFGFWAESEYGDQISVAYIDAEKTDEANLTEKQIADVLIERMKQYVLSHGADEVVGDIETISFVGEEHTAVKWQIKKGDVNYYETLIIIKKNMLVTYVTIVSVEYDDTEVMMDAFSKIND